MVTKGKIYQGSQSRIQKLNCPLKSIRTICTALEDENNQVPNGRGEEEFYFTFVYGK